MNKMRKRINLNAVCSSENYELSRKLHREYIKKSHSKNILEVKRITESIVIRKKCFVLCFGKLIEITEAEAARVEQSIKVIRL